MGGSSNFWVSPSWAMQPTQPAWNSQLAHDVAILRGVSANNKGVVAPLMAQNGATCEQLEASWSSRAIDIYVCIDKFNDKFQTKPFLVYQKWLWVYSNRQVSHLLMNLLRQIINPCEICLENHWIWVFGWMLPANNVGHQKLMIEVKGRYGFCEFTREPSQNSDFLASRSVFCFLKSHVWYFNPKKKCWVMFGAEIPVSVG